MLKNPFLSARWYAIGFASMRAVGSFVIEAAIVVVIAGLISPGSSDSSSGPIAVIYGVL